MKIIEDMKRKIVDLKQGVWSENTTAEVEFLSKEIEGRWKVEEEYWGQRSRLNWIRYGDKNSKFFHLVTVQRRERNKIVKIRNGKGDWVEEDYVVADSFKNFFADLFKSEGAREFNEALGVVEEVISAEVNGELMRPIEIMEVRNAVFQLRKEKAPGPDGFSGVFFPIILGVHW